MECVSSKYVSATDKLISWYLKGIDLLHRVTCSNTREYGSDTIEKIWFFAFECDDRVFNFSGHDKFTN